MQKLKLKCSYTVVLPLKMSGSITECSGLYTRSERLAYYLLFIILVIVFDFSYKITTKEINTNIKK